jgi:hypothetical protein
VYAVDWGVLGSIPRTGPFIGAVHPVLATGNYIVEGIYVPKLFKDEV